MDSRTRHIVRVRAGKRCEYCRLPEAADEFPFHLDHIVARVHGGNDDLANLSWSCTQCNLHKGSNFASIDLQSGKRVDLFNPRANGLIIGLTSSGRATVRLLDMNGSPQLDLRRELIQQSRFET
jgi:hypothetical protein